MKNKEKIKNENLVKHFGKFCPPHTWPHRFPWQKKIKNEPCHIHKNKIRLFSHDLHCWLLKCPHRKWK